MDKDFLLKYIKGDCSDSEKKMVADWLMEDEAHVKELMALHKLNNILIWQSDAAPMQEEESVDEPNRFLRIAFDVLKIAAAVILTILVYDFIGKRNNDTMETVAVMQTLSVPAGQRAELTLEDGTKVWINAKSVLTFPNRFSDSLRTVTLDGEGFFEIAKDKKRPFLVKTTDFNVTATGTSFNLMAYSGNNVFETILLDGNVEVSENRNNTKINMKPDQRAYLDNGELKISETVNLEHLLWKKGILCFDNESFAELVRKLELYFDVNIDIQTHNKNITSHKFTGKFRIKDGVEHVLKTFQLRYHFRYIKEDNNIIIK